jgi:hypothetical protein
MHRLLAWLFAVGLGVNAAWMIAEPMSWYAEVPGVSETGPYNAHFIRDIGCSYLVVALAFAALAVARSRATAAALAGAAFLSFHALVHLWDLVAGREHHRHALGDVALIALPAVLALWLAASTSGGSPARAPRRRSARGIVAWLVEPKLAAFERDFDYDTTYLREVARVSGAGFLRFGLFSVFAAHRKKTPLGAFFAAKLVAAMREDCGPCTQLVTRMAEREGVPSLELRGLLAGDESVMSDDVALAYRFTNAVLDRDIVEADMLRARIVERWGERALVTLSFTIASSRVFPTMKYALGHGKACSRVSVGGAVVPVALARAGVHE